MSIDVCPRCKEVVFSFEKPCQCKLFEVVDHEDDERTTQYGETAKDAAEAYAKHINEGAGDYSLMDTSRFITVGGKRFSIGAEPDIHYSIREVDSE